jgi:predicted GNAT family acetyltransferase
MGYQGAMTTEVQRNEERSRYELVVDGQLAGVADFHVIGDRVVLPHTEVDPARRGQGLGAILVRGALDDVRSTGQVVVPQCWYVAQFIDENPDYRDLLAA